MKKTIALLILALSLFALDGCKPQKKTIKKGKPIPCPIKDC
ncbi:hypothetical protein R9C00_09305 [Flammeovirgaceae bacterium SG7u.111]|nr:hypothetical protein [Flammeovirgaceae bacterium SG7u.132]WPO37646.1 hypothetical protein R9C00_09305 [Flammeovirgaceae bacterium SG7u.111]